MLFLKKPGTVAFIWDGLETGLFPKMTQYLYRATDSKCTAPAHSPEGAAPSPVAECPVASQLPLPTALPWAAVRDPRKDPCVTEAAQWHSWFPV